MSTRKASLAAAVFVGVVLSACASQGLEGSLSRGALYEFVEPDGWWKIDVPRGWKPVRVELDGSVTSISGKDRKTPDPSISPLRDPLASEVVYAFQAGSPPGDCPGPCPSGAVRELAIVARTSRHPDFDEATRRTEIELGAGSALSRIDVACPEGLRCVGFELAAPLGRTWVVEVDVPSQERVYQIKASAPLDDWPRLEGMFKESIASFRPLRP